jgi:TolB-like protein
MLWLLGSLAPTAAAAADNEPATTTTTTTNERPRVLVLTPGSATIDKATLSTIAGLMIVELAKDTALDVISDAEVKRLADLEGDRQAVGCDDTTCLAELAGAMGARYVIFGDVGTLGSTVIVNLNLFDSQTTRAVNRVAVKADGVDALPAALSTPLRELTAPLTGTTVRPAPAVSTSSGPPILPWVLVGSGAALAAGGILADNLSPTSSDDVLDGIDFVWPAAYCVAGPGLALTGLGMLLFAPSDDDQGAR